MPETRGGSRERVDHDPGAEAAGAPGPERQGGVRLRSRRIAKQDQPRETMVVVFDKGDEFLAGLTEFARRERLGVHVHAVLGRPDGTTVGGHLLEGRVWPTLETVLTEAPGALRKRIDPETGLALIDLDAS